MKKTLHQKGTLCMMAGLLLIGAALVLFCYNKWDANRADQAAQAVASSLAEQIPEWTDETEVDVMATLAGKEMPTIEVDGQSYIGLLEVPSLDLTLPVMEEWDYDRLKTAPCRYAGSAYEDDLVVAGHNYSRHFSQLKWLPTGSEIKFTDVDGNVFRYTVTQVETLQPDETDRMVEASDDWDLTLFTCTTGGGSRCTLRCVRTEP
jgi:sortase A